jgi:hypothetical protein
VKIFFSETAEPNEPKLGGKHLWKVLQSRMKGERHRLSPLSLLFIFGYKRSTNILYVISA